MRRIHPVGVMGVAIWMLAWAGGVASGNGLYVTNVTVDNVNAGVADVIFDLGWSNSWRSTWTEDGGATYVTTWDAAWVFLKYRAAGGIWKHGILSSSGHGATGDTIIQPASNGTSCVGAFVYRASEGSGPVDCPGMTLKWDYAASGLGGTNLVDVGVEAVEMVYVPQSSFFLGSGGTENYPFYRYPTSTASYAVTGEVEIIVGTNSGNLYFSGAGSGSIPATFPKGFQSFYCMKYEITQGQYAHFLNMLDVGSASARYPSQPGSSRHTIGFSSGTYTSGAPDRACNYLSWSDISACLDWACLRPMTELEFEKVCRGPLSPIANECAWGDTAARLQTGHSGVDGSGTETALPTNANCNCLGIPGPVRVGIFAITNSTRNAAGASYYGAMEMSGNVSDLEITAANTNGRSFTGTHGDGSIYTAPSSWPGSSAAGIGFRGGYFSLTTGTYERVSDRTYADHTSYYSSRFYGSGGRGVRTAP